MTIYEQAKELGIPMDNHESDLYLPVNDKTRILVSNHIAKGGGATTFCSQIDNRLWYDIPFAYLPWWEARLARTANK